MTDTLMINEMFYSIQGESTRAGQPCVFVRLTGCHLRCHYCDTEYAFHEGQPRTIDHIMAEVDALGGPCSLIEITGGEPLLQPNVHLLMRQLCDAGKTVLLETSGACDISKCDPRVVRIMDIKTPDSGEMDRNLWSNMDHLNQQDEVKFVICSREDYQWACGVIQRYDLARRVRAILMNPVAEMPAGKELPGTYGLSLCDLAEWIMADHSPVCLQTQLHKLIWDPMTRGV